MLICSTGGNVTYLRRCGNLIYSIMLSGVFGTPAYSAEQTDMPASAPMASAPVAVYGLIGKIRTKPGQRDALAAILLSATRAMPGCLSYIVANDATDPDALWITEVWDSATSHRASLALPEIKQAMQVGRPLIAGFGERFETRPLGGVGLSRP